jgi:hypothetical protein
MWHRSYLSPLLLSRIIGCCCLSASTAVPALRVRPTHCFASSSSVTPPRAYLTVCLLPANTFHKSATYSRARGLAMSVSPAAGEKFAKMAFGPKITVPGEHVFYQSEFSAAFVNLKPIVPGHVLVVPKRNVPRAKVCAWMWFQHTCVCGTFACAHAFMMVFHVLDTGSLGTGVYRPVAFCQKGV